jgi:hypothetical protein
MRGGKGGEFEIKVWEGGYPIWCEIYYKGERLTQVNSLELRDLGYAVEQARRAAQDVAQRMDPKRIDAY